MKKYGSQHRRDLPISLTRGKNAGFALSALPPDERAFLAEKHAEPRQSAGGIAVCRSRDGDFMQSAQNHGGFSC